MRRIGIGLCVLACILLLGSCAGIPRPETEENALVIGSFVLDYPDGIFEYPARTITGGIYLTIKNNADDSTFTVRTGDNGYFYFLSNGKDSYSLVSYRYTFTAAGRSEYSLEGGIQGAFTTVPGQVCFLGDLVFINAKGKKTEETTSASGERHTSWSYERSATRGEKPDKMIEFLRKQDAESPWLSRMVTTVKLQ